MMLVRRGAASLLGIAALVLPGGFLFLGLFWFYRQLVPENHGPGIDQE